MSDKKTKGGHKKMLFTPKPPTSESCPIPSPSTQPLPPKPHRPKPHSKFRPRPESTVSFTAFTTTKSTHPLITIKNEQESPMQVHELDPQCDLIEENAFDDDIMYVFSGIERGMCKIKVRDGKVYYEENGVVSEMVVKNIDSLGVVLMGEDVKEIGSVFNAYTVCRKEL